VKTSLKTIILVLFFAIVSFTSLYAIDISQLKCENGAWVFEGNKLQILNIYISGGVLWTKASDVTSFNMQEGALTIVTKERSITVVVSSIKILLLSIKDGTFNIYV
jgi:hypothetical protein